MFLLNLQILNGGSYTAKGKIDQGDIQRLQLTGQDVDFIMT
jgi:hypothetical protein